MIIYLDPKTYQFLGSYALKPGNIEVEIRFGNYEDGKFKPDIGIDTYNKLDSYLRGNKQFINKVDKEDSKVEIYKDRIRKIIYSDGRFIYQRKNKLYTNDIEYKDFILRLSESDEINLSEPKESYIIEEIRERKRTLYNHIYNAFYYALTEVKTISKGFTTVSYELEIEYNIKVETLPYFVRMVQDSINYILPILTKDKQIYGYIPLSEQLYVKEQYSSLYIKEPKPVNLTRYVTPDLQSMGYSLTNKLDGERFILIFTKIGFYAFNNRKTEKYDGKTYGNPTDNFIYYALDSEFFEGKYYVFDCMIYNGQKIIENAHEERIRDAHNILRTLNIPNNFINIKNFYRGDLKKDTEQLLSNLPKDKNDGLIYTSNGRYNSNIYKWKFPDKMSIDFSVYKIKDNTYELYVKDNIDDFPVNVPFHGSSTYELENALYESDVILKNGGIYEFGYNNDTEKFILFRERPDKIDPNFITVSQIVWNDIKNPYTEIELVNLLSPKVLEKYRKYQNNIKRDLIEKYCEEKDVLDLGSGRGGDLGKYDAASVNHLWCVEPNDKNYKELLRRLSERKSMKSKTTLITTVAQDTDKIVKSIRDTLVYDIPVSFTAKISLAGLLEEDKPYVKSFTVKNFNNLDHLKTIIEEVLLSEYNIEMEKNNFIVSNFSGDMIFDDYLFDIPLEYSDRIQLFVRYPYQKYDKNEVQDLGGDYKNWFPKVFGVDYNSLKITDEGMYSLTKHIDSVAIIRVMKNIIGEENIAGLTIMDGTSNVGGDTIRFGMYFKRVIGVELDKDNFEVLDHNVGVYSSKLNNISVINGDILDESIYQQVHSDILYLDPPWGGKGYKDYDEEKMVIFLSNVSLTQFIGNVLLNPVRPSYIFIKLPINYNIDTLRGMPYVNDMQVYKIRKFYLVCLLVDNKTVLKKADVLASFFSLSFFFFRDEMGLYNDLDKLVDTIDQTIKDRGYFIGTTIDGQRTKDLLDSLPNKKFDFEGGYIRITDEEKGIVELLIKETIVETQIESLVDFDLLQRKLYDKGIFLKESNIFENSKDLTERENILNSLYRTFVFQKETMLQKYKKHSIDILNSKQEIEFKKQLYVDDIFNIISLNYNTSDDSVKSIKCITHLDDLLQERGHIGYGDYSLLSFYYIPEITRILNKRFSEEINAYKEYYNGSIFNKSGTLDPNGIIQNIVSYNIKKRELVNIEKLFDYNLETILSCLNDIHTFSLSLRDRLVLSDPIIFLEKISKSSKSYKSSVSYKARILNYSYTKDKFPTTLPFYNNISNISNISYPFIEILQYMDISIKKNLYFSIDPTKSEFNRFLKYFLNIESEYNNIKQNYQVQILPGIMQGYNNDNKIESLDNIFMIQSRLYDRYEIIDNLKEEDYLYFEKIYNILNKKESNKIYKWLEILNFSLLDRDGNYTVFSNGYMPDKFLIAMKSYLNVHYDNFEWWANTTVDIPINKKCVNLLDIETANIDNVNYIDNKLNNTIDIYASYSSKSDIQRFIGDILFGLVTLKEDGLMLFNMTSYFRKLETSVIGLICDMFKLVKILKPMNSGVTESEVYFICNGYKRDNLKIEILKNVLVDGRDSDYYIPDSINVSKYSDLLIATYTNYGKQLYFMDKDMELYRKVRDMSIDLTDITREKLTSSSDKFISYYVKRRIDMNKIVKEIQNMFIIRKWNDHNCKKKIKKEKKKKIDVHPLINGSFDDWQQKKIGKGEILWGDISDSFP